MPTLLWCVWQAKSPGQAHQLSVRISLHQYNHLDLIGPSLIRMTGVLQSPESLFQVFLGLPRSILIEIQSPPTSCVSNLLPKKAQQQGSYAYV